MAKQIILLFTFLIFTLVSCQPVKNDNTFQLTSEQLGIKISSKKFSFKPTLALPTGGKSVPLTSGEYSLDITDDTIKADLPYYGRAYSAPYPGESGGVSFVSTDFNYQSTGTTSKQKVLIKIKDNRRHYNLSLEIWNTGKASLQVRENERSSIFYTGYIE